MNSPATSLERLKALINSSTPIVVMETVEEMRALSLVRLACSQLSLPSLSGPSPMAWSAPAAAPPLPSPLFIHVPKLEWARSRKATAKRSPHAAVLSPAGKRCRRQSEDRHVQHYDPVQALANLETMTIEAVFVLRISIATWTTRSWCAACATWARNSLRTEGLWF